MEDEKCAGIHFQKSPRGDAYLSYTSDDMQEGRKDGCLSAVLELVLALIGAPSPTLFSLLTLDCAYSLIVRPICLPYKTQPAPKM